MPQDWSHIKKPKGFASGFEAEVAAELTANNVSFTYEARSIPYRVPGKDAQFTPQFVLNNGIVIQSVGWFDGALRQKLLLLRKQCPDLDLRLVFRNPRSRISKRSAVTYEMWCQKYKFLCSGTVPLAAWCREPVNEKSLAVIATLKPAANRMDPVKARIEAMQNERN